MHKHQHLHSYIYRFMITNHDFLGEFDHQSLHDWIGIVSLRGLLMEFQEQFGFEVQSKHLWAAQVGQLLVELGNIPCIHYYRQFYNKIAKSRKHTNIKRSRRAVLIMMHVANQSVPNLHASQPHIHTLYNPFTITAKSKQSTPHHNLIFVDNNKLPLPNRKNQNLMFGLLSPYQKVQKTFVFQNQQTSQSIIIDLEIDFGSEFINLNHIFNRYCPLKANRVNIYEARSNSFVTLRKIGSDSGIFHKNLLEPSVILIRYRTKLEPPTLHDPTPSSYELDSQEKKDMRSRERSVGEAIDLVKKWRNLHLNCTKPNNNKKKINLQEAAKMLGVSKKSLDDYYCQLRLAEMYDFDFGKHLQEKMGVLRSYVKERKIEEEQKRLKPHRHPKKLKVIEDSEIDARIASQLGQRGIQRSQEEQEVKQEKPKAVEPSNTKELSQINFLQHQFYRGFEFLLDDPTDPFLTINKDFSKKLLQDQSDGILFY